MPDQDYPTLSLVGYAHGTSHFYHFLLPSLYPWLMADFALDFTRVGMLMSLFFLVSGMGQALAGVLVDRLGATRVLFFGLAMLALGALTLSMAHDFAGLLLAAGMAGLGNSVFHPADYTILNRRVTPARLGQAFSVHGLAGNAGWVLSPLLVVGLANQFGWRVSAAAAALVGVVCMLVLARAHALIWVAPPVRTASATRADETTATASGGSASGAAASGAAALARPGTSAAVSTLQVLTLPAVVLCFAFFLFTSAAFGTLQNFASPLLGHLYGMTPTAAASCVTAYLIGSASGTAAGGWWARAGRAHERTIMGALGLSAMAASLLATAALPGVLVVPLLALMGLGVGFTGPSRDLLVRKAATGRLGDHALGRVYGFVYSGLDAGLALAPLLFGHWMDRQAFIAVMVGIAVLQALAIAATWSVGLLSRSPVVQPV